MKTKSVLLCLSFIVMLSLATIPTVKADEVRYTWDSATHGTSIEAPAGQSGADAKAYADATGLTKIYVLGGYGLCGIVKAWSELYITLDGQGRYIKPSITYEVQGKRINHPTATITLTVIDRTTGQIVGTWQNELTVSSEPITMILSGDFFEAKSDREYLYWVKVYASAPIVIPPGYIAKADYYSEQFDYHIKVKQLYIRYNPQLTIIPTTGGHTEPDDGIYTYDYGVYATVEANACPEYIFWYWVLDGGYIYGNPITVYMGSDHTLTAYFLYDTSPPSSGGGTYPFKPKPR